MQEREYVAIAKREENHFWHVARREILGDILRKHVGCNASGTGSADVLDAGCGPGGNALFLREFGRLTGLDASPVALGLAAKRDYRELVHGDAAAMPFADGSFDLISSLDMVEHVPDDRAVLREFSRVLKPGGHALITVPAHQWLWSRHDRVLGHYRRYSLPQLRALVLDVGLTPVRDSHFIVPAVPTTYLRKTVDALTGADKLDTTYDFDPSPKANAALLTLLRTERAYLKAGGSIPLGTSLLMLARKAA